MTQIRVYGDADTSEYYTTQQVNKYGCSYADITRINYPIAQFCQHYSVKVNIQWATYWAMRWLYATPHVHVNVNIVLSYSVAYAA